MKSTSHSFFAPQLFIQRGTRDISFYEKAFGAVELRRFANDDETIHVSELSINGNRFHLHEETKDLAQVSPLTIDKTTVLLGLFVEDVDSVIAKAIEAGATLLSPAQSYDYGYRQGEIMDPFGHHWLIEMSI